MKVNFVGVGAIGLPMAMQVQHAGHDVTGVDVSDAAIAAANLNGIETVRSLLMHPWPMWSSSWSRRPNN